MFTSRISRPKSRSQFPSRTSRRLIRRSGLVPPIPLNFEPINDSANYSPIRAAMIGLTKAARSAECRHRHRLLNVARYGRVLKARRLVGLRGVGEAFDGLYYVKSVTSKIKRGEFKQDFTLTRNGLISTFSKVPV